MPFYEREDRIIDILSSCEEMTLNELSGKLFISLPTLRRDLIKLERKGLIVRLHGKTALKKNSKDTRIPFELRAEEHSEAKNIMAKLAVQYVKDGDVIMLDGSTSAYCIVPYLTCFKNIFVITSGAKTSLLLAHYGISNVSTGGRMINSSFSYVGEEALSLLSRYNADVAFISCRGVSEDGRVSDNSPDENNIRRAMLKQSQKSFLLCNGQKLGSTHLNNLCHISELDGIISDTELPEGLKTMAKK